MVGLLVCPVKILLSDLLWSITADYCRSLDSLFSAISKLYAKYVNFRVTWWTFLIVCPSGGSYSASCWVEEVALEDDEALLLFELAYLVK